jgi:hypothetical protein
LAILLAGCRSERSADTAPSGSLEHETNPPAIALQAPAPKRPEGALPVFVETAREAGVDFRRNDDIRGLHRIMESNGGGAALFDYDHDGRLDVFLTNGCRLPLRERTGDSTHELFQQRASWRFANATQASSLSWSAYGYGCTVGDYDNDGFDDLYVAAYREARLYRNQGDGTFEDVTAPTGTGIDLFCSSPAFGDLNRDGALDLFVATYVDTPDDPPELCKDSSSPDGYITCPPTVFKPEDDVLFLSDGQGGFVDVTDRVGVRGGPDGKGLGVVIFDADRNGWPDIFVANDGMPNYLYMNRTQEPGAEDAAELLLPRLSEEAVILGAAVNEYGKAEANMGIAHGDVDGDRWIDLLVTHFETETNTLYKNLEGQGFEDHSRASGLGPPSRPFLAFGAEFIDFDNNGWLDLFVANGHVDDVRWQPVKQAYQMLPQFFRNRGQGRFDEVTHWSGDYFREKWLGRGVAAGDIDNDGDPDLVISHQLAPSAVLRNDTQTSNRSVVLRLIGGPESNRSAFHAWVEAGGLEMNLVREIVGGGSYQSASCTRIHIGCGDRDALDSLTVHWPSGHVQDFAGVQPGVYLLREGDPELVAAPK